MSDASLLAPIALDALEAVTGGYHDPPSPTAPPADPSTRSGIAVGEPHPTRFPDQLGKLFGQIGPMIRCFSR